VKSFQFPLQRVLEWRVLQARTEEDKLAGLQHSMSELVHHEAALSAAELKSGMAVLTQESVEGRELQSLSAFRLRIFGERAKLTLAKSQCEKLILEQRKRVIAARRQTRVLENLRERRLSSWSYLHNRELEETAAENYISKWLRTESER